MTSQSRNAGIQFGLRSLFLIVFVFAIIAFVYRVTDWPEVVGVVLAIGLFAFIRKATWIKSLWFRMPFYCCSILILWTATVDFSWFSVGCKYCHSNHDVLELRVLHQPIWSMKGKEYSPMLRQIAEDLGAPCPHDFERFHLIRMWELYWPGPPFINGTRGLVSKNPRPNDFREQVRKLAEEEPGLGEEFRQRVLLDADYNYLRKFYERLQQ